MARGISLPRADAVTHVTMTLVLSPGMSYCEPDGGRIFLDLRRDRYFCLGTPADDAFTALIRGTGLTNDHRARLEILVATEILIDRPFGDCPRPCRKSPLDHSLLDTDLPKARRMAVAMTAVSIEWAKLELRRSSLEAICTRLTALKERRSHGLRRPRPGELAEVAASYAASTRVVGALDQCLACSLAIVRRCLARNIAANLVIGVKLRPFQAHAWAVADGALLSDRLATVRPFTPILIL